MELRDINPDRLLGDRAMTATIFAMTWQSTIEPVIPPRSNRNRLNMMLSIQAAQPDRTVSIASSSSAASQLVTENRQSLSFDAM